jgi:penicillin amidase
MLLEMRRALRIAAVAGLLLVLGLAGGGWWAYQRLSASLPRLDGQLRMDGLSAAVTVERDALGIPTIRGRSRADVARATGFLHAQDRFFQMDLSRRRAAGELAALVGPAALPVDRRTRLHRLRPEARTAAALLSHEDQAVLEAYTEGVNAGLRALAAPPFEYTLLRQAPEPWRPEDSMLVVLSMFLTLQDEDGEYESTLATMHEVLPQEMFDLMVPAGTDWDAPVVGAPFETAPVPGADIYNLRRLRTGKPEIELRDMSDVARNDARAPWEPGHTDEALGSNNWAVAGSLTRSGSALVANDMHLAIRVPNTWYRARLEWPDEQTHEAQVLVGTTLPGVPSLVTGSNTHLAWGFTNTYADWTDLVLLDVDPTDANRYQTPDGWQRFTQYVEEIAVAGQNPERLTVRWTIWGPVVGPDFKGRVRAARWAGHAPDRLGASLMPLERARTLEEAFEAANGAGIPGQNLVIGERSGRIGWTIFGAIPNRVGLDGRFPAAWGDGWRGWNGWLDPADYPRLIDPPGGRIWTANARVVDGAMLSRLGDGSYEVGSRATVVRNRLRERQTFTPQDMLDIQLDVSAAFLARWRDLILKHLSSDVMAGDPARQRFRDVVETEWSGEASPDSAGYRLTRLFRDQVMDRVIAFVLAECYEADRNFDYTLVRNREGAVWRLANERPIHLLSPRYGSWADLFTASIETLIDRANREDDGDLSARKWADYNQLAYRHPLSGAVPIFGRFLDMPVVSMPGDLFTPRMHFGSSGASERMVVSPGREHEGIMEMPTGQSGHPLSPFYSNSHDAWTRGEPSPFLPGPAQHTLTLVP